MAGKLGFFTTYGLLTEAESKENILYGDPILTISSPYVDFNTFTLGNPLPESTLFPSQLTLDLASDTAILVT